MGMKIFAYQFCVLMFLSVVDVKALSLTSCNDQLENEVCEITCNTTDHSQNVAFSKVTDTVDIIAQCAPVVGCIGTGHYNITQPSSVSTVLSFVHSRQEAGEWRCDYGINDASVSVSWATYPQNVSTTMTSNTLVNTDIHVNATLDCLYSEQNPTVTLQYKNSNGTIDAKSQTFECADTPVACTDVNFTTYACPVIIRVESGINHSDIYSIQLKTNVSHVETEDVKTIATGITFKPPSTSSTTPGSRGTNTPTEKDCKAIGILAVCGVIAYSIVTVMVALRIFIRSTVKKRGKCFLTFCQFIEDNFFDCCGNKNSKKNWLLGFTYLVVFGVIMEVVVLTTVYYRRSKFQVGLVIGVGFVIVLVLSGLCLLVVWMSKKSFKNEKSKCEEKPENSTSMITEKVTT